VNRTPPDLSLHLYVFRVSARSSQAHPKHGLPTDGLPTDGLSPEHGQRASWIRNLSVRYRGDRNARSDSDRRNRKDRTGRLTGKHSAVREHETGTNSSGERPARRGHIHPVTFRNSRTRQRLWKRPELHDRDHPVVERAVALYAGPYGVPRSHTRVSPPEAPLPRVFLLRVTPRARGIRCVRRLRPSGRGRPRMVVLL